MRQETLEKAKNVVKFLDAGNTKFDASKKFRVTIPGISSLVKQYEKHIQLEKRFKSGNVDDSTKLFFFLKKNSRCHKALVSNGFDTIDKVVDLFYNHTCHIYHIQNLGIGSVNHIIRCLKDNGYDIDEHLVEYMLSTYYKNPSIKKLGEENVEKYFKLIKDKPDGIWCSYETIILKSIEINPECIRYIDSVFISKRICSYIIKHFPKYKGYIYHIVKFYNLIID